MSATGLAFKGMPEAGQPVVIRASRSAEEAAMYGQRNGCRQVGLMALYILVAMVVTWLLASFWSIHRDVLALSIRGAPSPSMRDVSLVIPAGGDEGGAATGALHGAGSDVCAFAVATGGTATREGRPALIKNRDCFAGWGRG